MVVKQDISIFKYQIDTSNLRGRATNVELFCNLPAGTNTFNIIDFKKDSNKYFFAIHVHNNYDMNSTYIAETDLESTYPNNTSFNNFTLYNNNNYYIVSSTWYTDHFSYKYYLYIAPPIEAITYYFNNVNGGTESQNFTDRKAGSTVTYNFVPNSEYEVKSAKLYRFDTPQTSVDFTKGTLVKTWTPNTNNTYPYTITNNDIGKHLYPQVIFDKAPAEPTTPTTCNVTGQSSYENGTVNASITGNSINDVVTWNITPNTGYTLKSASLYRFNGMTLDSIDYSKGTDIKDFSTNELANLPLTYTITNDDLGNTICLQVTFSKQETPKTTLQTIGVDLSGLTNCTGTVQDNTVTLTVNNGFLFQSATMNIKNKYSFNDDGTNYDFTLSDDKKTATYTTDTPNNSDSYTVTDNTIIDPSTIKLSDKISNRNNEYHIYFSHASYTVDNNTNTITLKADDYFILTGATLQAENDDAGEITAKFNKPFTISTDGKTATLQVDKSDVTKFETFYLYDTVKQTSDNPNSGVYKGNFGIDDKFNNILKFTKDNYHTFTLTVPDNYIINGLNIVITKEEFESSQTFDGIVTIAKDGKSAKVIVPIDDLDYYQIYVTKDSNISKVELPTGTVTGKNTRFIYSLNDNNLKDLQTKTESYYKGGTITDYNFTDFINQLYMLPFGLPKSLGESSSNIVTGWFTLATNCIQIDNDNYNLDLGKISVNGLNGNGFDFNTDKCTLYLPYIAPQSLNNHDVINHTLHITYNINFVTGKTNVIIDNEENNLLNYQVIIKQDIDLFNIFENTSKGDLTTTLANNIKQAYIVINYRKPINNLISYPANEHGTLKDYQGYVKIKNINLQGQYNYNESSEIKGLLENGVIING